MQSADGCVSDPPQHWPPDDCNLPPYQLWPQCWKDAADADAQWHHQHVMPLPLMTASWRSYLTSKFFFPWSIADYLLSCTTYGITQEMPSVLDVHNNPPKWKGAGSSLLPLQHNYPMEMPLSWQRPSTLKHFCAGGCLVWNGILKSHMGKEQHNDQCWQGLLHHDTHLGNFIICWSRWQLMMWSFIIWYPGPPVDPTRAAHSQTEGRT